MGGQISRVVNGLYIGCNLNSIGEGELLQHGITHILSVQSEHNDLNISNNFQFKHILVKENDVHSLFKMVHISNDIIHEVRNNRGNIVVCSASGNNYNVCLVTIYLLTVLESLDVKSVLSYINHLKENHSIDPEIVRVLNSFQSECRLENEQNRIAQSFGDYFNKEDDLKTIKEFLDNSVDQEEFNKAYDVISSSLETSKPLKVTRPREISKRNKENEVFPFDQEDILEAIELETADNVNDEEPLSNDESSTDELVSDVESTIEQESAIEIPLSRGRERSSLIYSASSSLFISKDNFDPKKLNKLKSKGNQENNSQFDSLNKLSTTVPAKKIFMI